MGTWAKSFPKPFAQNKQALEAQFGGTVDLYMKDVQLCGISCCICMFEGLSSIERLWIMMLDSLSKPQVMPRDGKELLTFLHDRTAIPLESNILSTFEEVRTQLTAGTSVILIDGAAQALVLSTQSMQFRSVSEPSGENNLRGSGGGVGGLPLTSAWCAGWCAQRPLWRKRLPLRRKKHRRNWHFYMTESLCLSPCWMKYAAAPARPGCLLFDTGYLAPFLQRGYFSFFQSVGYTERPDTAAAKICEGKIVLMANGSPFAMLIPYFLVKNFSSMDDYSEKAYFATLVRCLKYAAFLIAVMLQGVFVSIANFTPELLPKEMLYKIAASEQATPLPLFSGGHSGHLPSGNRAGSGPAPLQSLSAILSALWRRLLWGTLRCRQGLWARLLSLWRRLRPFVPLWCLLCTSPLPCCAFYSFWRAGFWARWALQACFSACWCRPAACMRSASRILRLLRPLPAVFLRDGIIRLAWPSLAKKDIHRAGPSAGRKGGHAMNDRKATRRTSLATLLFLALSADVVVRPFC